MAIFTGKHPRSSHTWKLIPSILTLNSRGLQPWPKKRIYGRTTKNFLPPRRGVIFSPEAAAEVCVSYLVRDLTCPEEIGGSLKEMVDQDQFTAKEKTDWTVLTITTRKKRKRRREKGAQKEA
eukprot:scaffold3255_cov191-Ochromonas_danica.AAC.14